MKSLTLAIFLFSVTNLATSQCTQIFSAASINAVQYPVESTHNYPPPVVSGIIALNLQFRTIDEMVATPQGVSLRYTVDNQPVGPVLTDDFAWNLDTTEISEGTHSISVLYVNEPPASSVCYVFSGRQYAFVVENSGHPITGSQQVPVISPPPDAGPMAPQYADFINYPGYQPHSTAHPLAYQFIPPAGGTATSDL